MAAATVMMYLWERLSDSAAVELFVVPSLAMLPLASAGVCIVPDASRRAAEAVDMALDVLFL